MMAQKEYFNYAETPEVQVQLFILMQNERKWFSGKLGCGTSLCQIKRLDAHNFTEK